MTPRILLAITCVLCLGCADGRTGENPNSRPLALPYSERHTFPLVALAVLPQVTAGKPAGQGRVYAWDFRGTRDPSLVKIVETKLAGEALDFVPLAEVSDQDGQYWHADSRRPARICSITSVGSNDRGLLRFRVECHSGLNDKVQYEVRLRGTPESTAWSVDRPKIVK